MAHDIHLDFKIKEKPSEVFKYLTDPNHLENWWPLKCSGSPELGAEYNFNFTDKYDWYGKVSKVEKDKSFFIRMTKSDADWDPTSFGWVLAPEKEGTLLMFSHTGWPEMNHELRTSAYCWAQLFRGLKEYVEEGVIIPFEKRS